MQRGPTRRVNRRGHPTRSIVVPRLVALALVTLNGCDSVVVLIDRGSDEGAAGGASASPQGTGGYDGAGAGPSSTVHDACKRLCVAVPSCDAKLGCVERCEEKNAPGCDDAYAAVVDCQSQTGVGPDCSVAEGTCTDELWAFKWCRNPNLCTTDGACISDGATCACEGSCDEGAISFSTSCSPYGDSFLCKCSLAGVFIGNCVMDTLDCSVEGGCCADIYQ